MKSPIRRTVLVALAVLVALEAVLHLAGDRLGEPQLWYSPRAQQAVAEMDRLAQADVTSDLVLAGSSMVEFGFRSELLEDALDTVTQVGNVGIPKGYTTVTRRWLLDEVLPRLGPNRVIWGLTSLDFNAGRPTPALPQYEEARAGARGFFGWLDRRLWSVSMISRYRDLLREPSALLGVFEDPVPEETQPELVDLLTPTEWPDVAQTDRAFQALRGSLLHDFSIGDQHAADFEYTMAALADRGIELVVVLLPVSEEFVNAHPEGEATFERFRFWLRSEVASRGVPVFDYSKAISEGEFLDYNHISPNAASVLTGLLIDDLRSLGW